ncbi:MAG: glycosyltransferase family 4 protein [Gammaproteobacteria bacterium]|nr:glycosyltransferase family 4 protein [Gammaproteobacteria bacterium]MBU1416016.1 glycosyltransferase family 4 protein [Gammaproteobacteria bacterium]
MKLALVRQKYTPFGGAERFVERALVALENQGVSVTLIARQWAVDVRREGIACNPFYLGRLWRDAGFARCVQRVVAGGDFDIVQSHERIPGCNLFRAGDGAHAAWLALRARREGPLGRWWLRWSPWHRYILNAETRMFRDPRLKAVICISRMVRDDIVRHFGVDAEKLHVIYNGLDLDDFHPGLALRHRRDVRAQLDVADDTPVFLYVGSGFARKGVATLIAAAAGMANPAAQFWIVGKDKHSVRYRRLAQRLGVGARFRFLGSQRDVRPYLGSADAFVLPTLYEPLSNAVLEALASGLPAIITDTCGAAELIRPGESGYVCAADDVAALARHLDALAVPGAAAGMRAAARASVAHLGIDAMTERLIALYRGLLPVERARL